MDYVSLLQTIADRYSAILEDNLVGIYVHGSIAFQCFNWDESDIDFIVVVKQAVSEQRKLQLLAVLEALWTQAPAKGFEMSVVQLKHCQHFVYPTPYELHASNACWSQYLENPRALCTGDVKTDSDLAAHFTVIKHRGIVLCGEPISLVFGDVPAKDYLDSLRLDMQNAERDVLDHPVSVVLNLCRVYAYLKDQVILSKEEGGQWALDHLPRRYADVVAEALRKYSDSEPFQLETQARVACCAYMRENIFNTMDMS